MSRKTQAPVIVVTGGTGVGKSTAAEVFKRRGKARVVNVDRLSRRLLRPGEAAWREVIREFCGAVPAFQALPLRKLVPGDFLDRSGKPLPELPWVIHASGEIRRDKLGATVFTNAEALETLNRIMHPRLRKLLDLKIKLHRRLSRRPLVLDMAVYPARPFRGLGDAVLWVRAPGGLRAQRLADSKRLSLEEAAERIRLQWNDETFSNLADFVLPNLGSDADLRHGAEEMWPKLLTQAEGEA